MWYVQGYYEDWFICVCVYGIHVLTLEAAPAVSMFTATNPNQAQNCW